MATKDQLIASAQKNLEKGQLKKAIKDYQDLLKLEPNVDQHKQKLADLLYRANFKEDALVIYGSLAKNYAERGFFAKGVAVYKQMQRIDAANPEVYLRLAELNRNLGLMGNAMSEYRTLLGIFEKSKKVAEAADVLQKMVEIEPDNISLQVRVLQNYLNEKLYVKATEATLKACDACAKSGDSAKAQKILQSILSHLPDNHELHNEIATKLSAAGLFAEATYLYQALLKYSPNDPLILNALITLYDKSADVENQLLYLDQLLVVAPVSATAERLVRLCLAAGDYGRAQRTLVEHEALLDDEGHSLLIDLYQELEKHLPGNPQVRNAIVRLFGGSAPIPEVLEVSTPPSSEVSPSAEVEDLSLDDEEFGLDDLLAPRPRSSETAPPPPAEEIVEEEPSEISVELSLEDVVFDDIDTFSEELTDVPLEIAATETVFAIDEEVEPLEVFVADEIEQPENLFSPGGSVQFDVNPPVINIDFDFSQFDDDDEALEIEISDDLLAAPVEDLPFAAEIVSDLIETTPELKSLDDVIDDHEDILELEPLEELEELSDYIEPLEEEEEEISSVIEPLEEEELSPFIEPLEEEEEEYGVLVETLKREEAPVVSVEPPEEMDDLSAQLAELEDLLDAEMEEASTEERAVFNVAVDSSAGSQTAGDDDFFDLAAEILDDGAMQATEDLANVDELDRFRFDSVFSEFKKGVDAQIDHDDSEAHYDLGIAYKEMGLRDDAIEEFKKSMRSPKRLADSLILIGICYAEKGSFAEAETVFSTAISRSEVQSADKIGAQYELGLVYEVWGRPADALRTFEAVGHNDPSFRNVGEKIEAIRLQISAGSSYLVGNTPEAASPGKNRVSFV